MTVILIVKEQTSVLVNTVEPRPFAGEPIQGHTDVGLIVDTSLPLA